MDFPHNFEELKVQAGELVDKVKELIHEGNVRRIIIKDESGHTFMELPLTVAAVGVVAVPVLAALGALAAMVAKFQVVVERSGPPPAGSPAPPPPEQ
jgi:hypothetical protein